MRFQVLFFLLFLSCLYLTMAQGSYDDCCLRYSNQIKPRVRRIVKYRIQGMGGGCNIHAIVFTLRKGRQLCGDPQNSLVQDLMRMIDMRKKPGCCKNVHKEFT